MSNIMSPILALFSLFVVNCFAAEPTIYGMTLWTSYNFYYRAIAAIYLRVIYYSNDHTNILDYSTLTEIHNIEQQIKSWPKYNDHSLIYKETDADMQQFFPGVSSLYLSSPPDSAINYMFPQVILDHYFMNGDGGAVHKEWMSWINDISPCTWFNRDTFSSNTNAQISPYIVSFYPFGYMNGNETKEDLYAFVESYSQLFDTITSDKISIKYSNSRTSDFVDTLNLNTPTSNKIYESTPTPQPTPMPTPNNSYTEDRTLSNCYSFGYSTSTGQSTGAIVAIATSKPTKSPITGTDNPTLDTKTPVSEPTESPITSTPTSAPTIDQIEVCRETFWPRYMVVGNNNDMIYFDNYRWNMVDGNNEYYCNVMVKDLLFCNGQWQRVDNGEYVDIMLDINVYLDTTTTQDLGDATTTRDETQGDGTDVCYGVIKFAFFAVGFVLLY